MSSIKKICLCAICTALCYVLPLAFHPLVMGTALSPMHIPVLLWHRGITPGAAGIRETFGDVGATILKALGAPSPKVGNSIL